LPRATAVTRDEQSGTPAYKSVPVRITRELPGQPEFSGAGGLIPPRASLDVSKVRRSRPPDAYTRFAWEGCRLNRLVFGMCVGCGFALGLIHATGRLPPTPLQAPDSKPGSVRGEKPEGRRFEPFKPKRTTEQRAPSSIDGATISVPGRARARWWYTPKDLGRRSARSQPLETSNPGAAEDGGGTRRIPTVASMFYVRLIFKEPGRQRLRGKGAPAPHPHSYSTAAPGLLRRSGLHMGSIRAAAHRDIHRRTHARPAALFPRQTTPRACSMHPTLVFIDAPGTGFSPDRGQDKEKAFSGVDQDAYAFSPSSSRQVPSQKYVPPWNSPQVSVR